MNLKKELREAIKAHNQKKETSANDNWNKANKCGTIVTRKICRAVSIHETGMCNSKITWKQAVTWAWSMLPVGAGYKSQDTTEDIKPYVDMLREE